MRPEVTLSLLIGKDEEREGFRVLHAKLMHKISGTIGAIVLNCKRFTHKHAPGERHCVSMPW